ncbi:hypothetical protein K432DRAFT_292119, partial [Lepidopterella palustris CBS 459.81]
LHPTRTIYLGLTNDHLKLFERPNLSSRYTALSYCLGLIQPIKTLCSTLNIFKSHLDWTSLPLAFQNTVEVARRLRL